MGSGHGDRLGPGSPVLKQRFWLTPATLGLVLGAGYAWSLCLAAPVQGRPLESAWRAGAKISVLIEGGQAWRLVIAPLHHVGFAHLAVNLVIAGALGAFCARLLGNPAALAVFFVGAWTSTAASAWLNPAAWSLGASGGGYALTGALVAALALGGRLRGIRAQLALLAAAGLIGLQISLGGPQTDRVAHVSGLIAGFVLGGLITAWRKRFPEGGVARPFASGVRVMLAGVALLGVGWAEARQYALVTALGEPASAPQTADARERADAAKTGCTWARPVGWVDEFPADVPSGGACQTNGLARACLLPAADLAAVETLWFGGAVCPNAEHDVDDFLDPTAWRLHRRSRIGPGGETQNTLWTRAGVPYVFAEAHLVEYEVDPRAVPGIYAVRESVGCPESP